MPRMRQRKRMYCYGSATYHPCASSFMTAMMSLLPLLSFLYLIVLVASFPVYSPTSSFPSSRLRRRATPSTAKTMIAAVTTPPVEIIGDAIRSVVKPPTALSITQITENIFLLENGMKEKENERMFDSDLLMLIFLRKIRSFQLDVLLRTDPEAYVATATFLSSSIPRSELPNVQDVPHPESGILQRSQEEKKAARVGAAGAAEEKDALVPDCTVPDKELYENPLEALLLTVTRNIYADITGTERRKDIKGIPGLVEEMRTYMLSPKGMDPKDQQNSLLATLLVLMTPVLPPFYRIFMGWRVPSKEAGDPEWLVNFVNKRLANWLPIEEGQSFGPAPYAPLLTSWVAPYVFSFLVGPVSINLRKDGQYGGILVEKCKFLQESNCKGMCLHSCKIPAQNLFDSLGLPLRVSPNFDSQECQWNFGEVAPPPEDDPTWPQGCLVGCGTREAVAKLRKNQAQTEGKTEVANCY